MKYENAYRSVVEFLGSNVGSEFDLTDAQAEELAKRLVMRVKPDLVMVPEAVLSHAEALFPKPDEDYVRRTTPPQQQKQSRDEVVKAITAFFNSGEWPKVAPGTIPAVTSDAKIGSRINHAAFFGAVDARYAQGGLIRADYLSEIVLNLFLRGALEKYPAPVEVVPPPPPPSPQELIQQKAKREAAVERLLQNRDTSPIRGAKEAAQPLIQPKVVLTEQQLQTKEAANRETDAIIAEAQHRISMFQGRNHARTFSARAELNSIFAQAMDEGLDAKVILARVDQAIERLSPNNSIR